MRTIKDTIKAINGRQRGAYVLTARRDTEWNEIIVVLHEVVAGRKHERASSHFDCGHTREDRHRACVDALRQANGFLRIDPNTDLTEEEQLL